MRREFGGGFIKGWGRNGVGEWGGVGVMGWRGGKGLLC